MVEVNTFTIWTFMQVNLFQGSKWSYTAAHCGVSWISGLERNILEFIDFCLSSLLWGLHLNSQWSTGM